MKVEDNQDAKYRDGPITVWNKHLVKLNLVCLIVSAEQNGGLKKDGVVKGNYGQPPGVNKLQLFKSFAPPTLQQNLCHSNTTGNGRLQRLHVGSCALTTYHC